ncbi:MAG: hypothetical protein HQL56_17070 [Magnetococcales bacterium]|nr:hypothetical protein [Magnetococcales bacterium]
MASRKLTLTLAQGLVERLDRLLERAGEDSRLAPRGRLTRAELIRLLLVQGCDRLEMDSTSLAPFPPVGGPLWLETLGRPVGLLGGPEPVGRFDPDLRTLLEDETDRDFEPF